MWYTLVFLLYFKPETEPYVLRFRVYPSMQECSDAAQSMTPSVRALYGADGAQAICAAPKENDA